jgi:hypothetical protein
MFIVVMKEVKLIVVENDSNFEIKDVVFEANVFNRYFSLIELQIGMWKI